MNELIEIIRSNLDRSGELTEVILNAISLIFIAAGVMVSVVRSFRDKSRLSDDYPLHMYFRMVFGGWLVVALEFQLAADIVGTIISPTPAHLVQLGAVALIRTFLNYFLNKELKEQTELSRTVLEKNKE